MPSQLPSSFASAAAGQSSTRDGRSNVRGDGRGSGEWPRRDNRSANGTLTLRRTSTTPYAVSSTQSTQPDLPQSSPEASSNYTTQPDGDLGLRYSKTNLIDIYQNQLQMDYSNGDVSRLFVGDWNPGQSTASNGRGWGKPDTRDHNHGPEICWDQSGQVQPIGLEEMSTLEKTIFSGDVNSPLKPPVQTANKDQGTPSASNGRRTSVTQGQGGIGNFGLASPTTTRPGNRRRETSDSVPYSGLTSPSANRFNREEQSSFFARKSTDLKDSVPEADNPTGNGASKPGPFGSLMRSNTAGSALGNGPASPWGPSPASAVSPMGNFGSFALGGVPGQQPVTPSEKRPGFGSIRGESRLAHLMPKESSEAPADTTRPMDSAKSWRSRVRPDEPADDTAQSGSAALGGGEDTQQRGYGLETPSRQSTGVFGMSDAPAFRDSQSREQSQQYNGEYDPQSPTETNPFTSPPDERGHREDLSDVHDNPHHGRHPLGGISEHPANSFGHPRGFQTGGIEGSDRSQTSSAGVSKGFPSLGGLSGLSGLGGLSGWPSSANPIGTPDRERQGFQGAFGNSIFGPMGDLPSPNLSSLGPTGQGPASGVSGNNTIGRGSKLGSLFPAAMQAQMQTENENSGDNDSRQAPFGTIGRNTFNGPPRDTDSPMRGGRGVFDDIFAASETRGQSAFSGAEVPQSAGGMFSQAPATAPSYQQSHGSSDSPGIPQAQQRQMVMPDRMRWVYLDPQGQTQGPWSGLEMHDWYKASFFTADLSVKKVEDAEFEPLGQLIRRIGNSREPFLVPQIGVPHGPSTTQPGSSFAPAPATTGAAAQPGAVQPPFAGAFPSFGTTLTAEQQNNLERRKQEEQYLMARQREFLAQQQVNMKQMQMQGGLPASLHHHSSAHSLQSQPSFSSITSPGGMPQGGLPGVSSFFDAARNAPTSGIGMPGDYFREDELARLSLQDRQAAFGAGAPQVPTQLPSLFGQQGDASRIDQLRQMDPQGNPRLREFEQLRAQIDMEQLEQSSTGAAEPIGPPQQRQPSQYYQDPLNGQSAAPSEPKDKEVMSLTEQVQKAASAKQTPDTIQPGSPWGKPERSLPMPFPPPQSTTPLPAPTAQRGRSDLAEALHMGTRSRSETPEVTVTTPSVAPWAKESIEGSKGPSLKEIQETEAKKAAKIEEAALASRRAIAEAEARAHIPSTVPAPGLPTSSTWATSGSPAPTGTPSAWAKPAPVKAVVPSSSASSKKTLADIQREEESRKAKLAATTAVSSPGPSTGGKRYADLASKVSIPAMGSSWSTVGAGGKVKTPSGSSAALPALPSRSISTAAVPTMASKVSRPTGPSTRSVTSVTTGHSSSSNAAHQEFTKWSKAALAKGLDADINVDDFVVMLSSFPLEAPLIADSVYANSQLMDGRRFAEEYIRRRKLADKGIVEHASASNFTSSTGSDSKGSGGWNEVAKKGPQKEEPTAGFKVVPNKKKGRK